MTWKDPCAGCAKRNPTPWAPPRFFAYANVSTRHRAMFDGRGAIVFAIAIFRWEESVIPAADAVGLPAALMGGEHHRAYHGIETGRIAAAG